MKLAEIVLGTAAGAAVRVAPHRMGVTVVSTAGAPGSLTAGDAAGAVRDTLSKLRREGSAERVPFVRVTFRDDNDFELSVADDASAGVRMMSMVRPDEATPLELDAAAGDPAAEANVELILAHVARVLGLARGEDLGPALAFTRATEKAAGPAPSPDAAAYHQAHARAAALGRQVRSVDHDMTASVVPDWLWIATAAGGVGVLMTAVTFYNPELRIYVVPAMFALLVVGLAAYAWRSAGELRTRGALQEARARLKTERDLARSEASELAKKIAAAGGDPDQVLAELSDLAAVGMVPVVLSRAALDGAALAALEALGRQVIVFTEDAGGAPGAITAPLEPLGP